MPQRIEPGIQNFHTTAGTRGIDRAEAIRALTFGRSVLYAFLLSDGVIKIGCTENLVKRRCDYAGAEILAFTFGDFDDEAAIHALLVSELHHGHEYYNATAPVIAVVNEMREAFNLEPLAS